MRIGWWKRWRGGRGVRLLGVVGVSHGRPLPPVRGVHVTATSPTFTTDSTVTSADRRCVVFEREAGGSVLAIARSLDRGHKVFRAAATAPSPNAKIPRSNGPEKCIKSELNVLYVS
jgi:hypothetical protein